MIEVTEAEALIRAQVPRWPDETVRIDACTDRILREDIHAERDQPPFDRVTMDGIAIAYRDWADGRRDFQSAGVQAAGAPALRLERVGDCIQVMTGAMLPEGADTVIPVERLQFDGPLASVAEDTPVRAGQNVHPRGSDAAGGIRLLNVGARLGPAEVAVLASAGRANVAVAALPKVAIVSTGDELVGAGDPIAPHQIRSCNELAIAAALSRHRLANASCTRLKDDADRMLEAAQRLHDEHDVLILSGGVSMGQFDFVPNVLERLGATLVFHRVEQKPGRPMWFGVSRDGKPVFALPGNPVSTLVCTARYLLPAFRQASGYEPDEEWVRLGSRVDPPPGLTYFLPVKMHSAPLEASYAEPRPTNTSGDFVSLAGTDGFVELTPQHKHYSAGSLVRLYRW
jgi:molybdopterin molybdotransferase